MNRSYRELTEGIKERINPENTYLKASFLNELASVSYSDVFTYIRFAMKGVEESYTEKSIRAGENVKKHLDSLNYVEFRYQGSVMTNTHIRGYSDIDLVAISSKFYSWAVLESEKYINEPSGLSSRDIDKLLKEKSYSSYLGNYLDDLRNLRIDSENILKSKYVICDINQPKCIKLKNQDLNRKVDVVIANWYDDVRSIINDKGENRGIEIYNKQTNSTESPDYPFTSIKRINERGNYTNGRLKKMIRFLKNVKADSNLDIDLSSFDINAICYDIDPKKYLSLTFLELVPVIYLQLHSICNNESHANDIISVDQREYIFRYNQGKLNNVRKVLAEIQSIYFDLNKVKRYA